MAAHFFAGDFCAVAAAAGDAAAGVAAAGEVSTAGVGVGVGVGVAGCSGMPDCKTELVPVIAGSDNIKAINMNAAAAPIVILDSRVCVPRGPNAVLETELENSAPASALPGCKRIVTTRMTHARINNPYKR
jgi:hypothetical protein